MADPLSVSASIAGLVTLADIVFRRTYLYVKAVKSAQKEISALSAEVGALYGILSNLRLVSRQLEEELFESTTRIHHIHSCYQTLEHVRSILGRDDTTSLRDQRLETLKLKLRWPFTSSEVKTLVADIERHKATLGLALNVDCMSGLLQALSKNDEIRSTIEEMRTEVKERHEAATRIAINEERERILKSFSKVDSRSNHAMSRKLRSPGTGIWLTEGQEFKEWLETKNARLWFYGIPGAGKTVLASSIIEEALRTSSPSTAVAFFYCDYKDGATQDLSNILSSLAQQFAKQDEESFAKLKDFYETYNHEHRLDFKYDSEALLDLLRAVTSVFDCAMIIVDGLDECGTNTAGFVDSLITLSDDYDTSIKTILLSRDEIEIRERLENYTKVSIAARSSDLRLYVGAEIDLRTRKKRLRIKDQSLKEYILERLVEGAEGMFRWVTCQMDYLCELPNDAARRVALDSLPPDLKSTYERILNRVNQSNPEAQKLVRRSLRWIANVLEPDPESYQFDRIDTEYFNTRALCEAVSIDLGSAKRNPQTIPDEFEILHWCSSLVRKSADGQSLELAHFTVEEFLKQIDPGRDLSIAQYRIEPITDGIILAKVCLTYLNLEDFDQTDPFRLETVESRFQKFPFRKYAVASWPDAVRDHLNDNELFSLVQKLLNPSKPSTFVTWTHDVTFLMLLELEYIDDNGEVRKKPFNSGLPDMTTLHWAAIYKLSEVGIWLINSGCDVNRNSALGTPLLCASDMDCYYSMGWKAKSKQSSSTFEEEWAPEKITFIEVLLDAGADPNCLPDFGTFAVYHGSLKLVMRLVDMGLVLDSNCLHSLETRLGSEDISEILDHTSINSVHPQNRDGLIQLALKAKASNATSLIQEDMELPHRKKHYEVKLRTAAEYGQVDVVRDLLEAQKLDVDAADQNTGKIALHHAAETDHIEVAQMLIDHGADSSKADSQGKTAVHHSLRGRDLRCLKFFVHGGADTIIQDLEGMTIWHLAAQEGNAQALTILLNRSEDSAPAIDIKAKNGKTPLLCASGGRSKEAVSLLLNAGSNLDDTASDGSSSLHYAAESGSPENSESGSLEVVEFLMEQGVDPFAVTGDGLNAIHRAIASGSRNTAEIVRGLLEKGLDAHTAHNDGYMPLLHLVKHESRYLHLSDLVKKIKQDSLSPEQLDCLFAASQALLKSSLKRHRFVFDMELGSELLNLACLRSSSSAEKTVSALMDLGLDFNIRFDGGMPALMVAAEKGKGAILSILLRNGADPCINASGLNALHCACFNDHIDIVVRLRESGVDWNSKATATICGVSRDMVTALHIAAQIRNGEILAYLLEEKLLSDINARTSAGQTALTVAVLTGASRNVSLLLSNGADDTFIDHFGHSAIQEAAQYGLEDVIAEFIQHGSDLGVPNSFGLTPELLARTCGHEALAKTITSYVNEQGVNPTAATCSPRPETLKGAFEMAIDTGDLDLCKHLIGSGTDLVSGFQSCLGCRPFLYSLQSGQFAIAEYLIARGASVAGSSCERWLTRGFTAFHHAAASGSVRLLQLLLEKAPGEIYVNNDPIHPIHIAVLKGNDECVELILEHVSQGRGRSLSDQLGTFREALTRMVDMQVQGDRLRWSWYGTAEEWFPSELETAKPLHIATYKKHLQILRILLAYGASVDGETAVFMTPLHYAALNGDVAMLQLILDAGANPNVLNSDLESPCMQAVKYRNVDAFLLLLQRGADIQLRSFYGETALHLAASFGTHDLFASLATTATEQQLEAVNYRGSTALYDAIRRKSAFPMGFLLNSLPQAAAYGSRRHAVLSGAVEYRSATEVKMLLRRLPTELLPRLLNYRDPNGTPLHIAAILSKLDIINLLLDAGAQLELEGSEHGTPLMAACATGRLAAVKLLIARGARTSYVKEGQVYSVLTAAKYHPQVRQWLFVGRFLEGPRLLTYGEAR